MGRIPQAIEHADGDKLVNLVVFGEENPNLSRRRRLARRRRSGRWRARRRRRSAQRAGHSCRQSGLVGRARNPNDVGIRRDVAAHQKKSDARRAEKRANSLVKVKVPRLQPGPIHDDQPNCIPAGGGGGDH